MKKLFFLAVVAGVALVSCNKTPIDLPDIPNGRPAEITFSLSTKGMTKATTAKSADEAKANTVDLFVFNADRKLDAYGHWTAAADPAAPVAGEFKVIAGGIATNEITEGSDAFSNRLACTTGAGKKVYAILNSEFTSEAMNAIATEAQLQGMLFTLAANRHNDGTQEAPDYVLDNFEMVGYSSADFHVGKNDISISVDALVARVEIKKIKKNFTSSALNGNLTIKRVFMSNVVASTGFADDSAGGWTPSYKNAITNPWFNVYGFDSTDPYVVAGGWPYAGRIQHITALDPWAASDGFDTDMDCYLYKGLGVSEAGYALAEDATLCADGAAEVDAETDAAHSLVFYVMPNQVPWGYDNDSDESTPVVFGPMAGEGAWSPRHTKLVVEVEYAGATYYYPIPIAQNGMYPMGAEGDDGTGYQGIKSNYSYEIELLELTRLGSRNPDECVLPADVKFNITVNAWTQQLIETERGKYVI